MSNINWLERVSFKLYQAFLGGKPLGKWVPDQVNPEAESHALDTLEIAGVIKSPGGYEGAPQELQYRIIDLKAGNARSAPTRQIIDFDYDKFVAFCEEHGLNYKDNRTTATLVIIDQQPSVRAGGREYSLKTLQDGSPLTIIEQALAHPGEKVTFDKLRQWTGKPNAFKSQNNFNQIFRNNELGKGNILHSFAEISSTSFILKEHALLTPAELSAIQKVSIN